MTKLNTEPCELTLDELDRVPGGGGTDAARSLDGTGAMSGTLPSGEAVGGPSWCYWHPHSC